LALEQSSSGPGTRSTAESTPLNVKHVVTAFLSHHGRILVLRRSNKVGSYRGRWAGISGYVERDEVPLERALKEVSEEVGLKNDEVSLVKAGRPLPALDEDIDTLFVVHPFLFFAKQSEVKLDWEHDAFRWVRRQDLRRFETVPKLREALDRVLDDISMLGSFHRPVLERLAEIREDRIHGASELSRQSLRAMPLLAQTSNATTPEDLLAELRVFGQELMNSRPNMASLTNLVGRLLCVILAKRNESSTVEELKQTVANTCQQIVEESKNAVNEIGTRASSMIQDGMTVFTHSQSATVLEALKVAAKMGRRIRAIVTESRPLFEGRIVAQGLSAMSIPVTLAVDAAVGYLVETADLCIVGADCVLSDGSVVNKIGTFPLAMSAREHGKPFYVLCEKSKFNLRSLFEAQPEMEERGGYEVLPYAPNAALAVRNPYFDRTPSKLVSKLITEDGELSFQELPRVFREMLSNTYL